MNAKLNSTCLELVVVLFYHKLFSTQSRILTSTLLPSLPISVIYHSRKHINAQSWGGGGKWRRRRRRGGGGGKQKAEQLNDAPLFRFFSAAFTSESLPLGWTEYGSPKLLDLF